VQDRHLESIRAATFLWLVCPDGYVGQSASMEIGYAVREGVPIFATRAPADLTLRQYVKIAPSLATTVKMISTCPQRRPIPGILIDPHASLEKAHQILDRIGTALARPGAFDDAAHRVGLEMTDLRQTLALPAHV